MASGHPLILRNRSFGAKLETVAGTAVALADADAAMILYDPSLDYDAPMNARPAQHVMSQRTGVPGTRAVDVAVTAEMAGLGSSGVPLWASTLLAASGFALSTATYSPSSGAAAAATLSVGLYTDGVAKLAAGCMFGWTMTLADGMPGKIAFKGRGKYVAPADTAILAPTYPTVIPPPFRGATCTIGGTQYTFPEISIECNNTLYLREDASDATGFKACCITGREILIKVSPESALLATKDWYGLHTAGTTAAFNIILNGSTNNTITVAAPAAQLQAPPKDADRNGIWAHDLVWQCNLSGNGGDDELTLLFA